MDIPELTEEEINEYMLLCGIGQPMHYSVKFELPQGNTHPDKSEHKDDDRKTGALDMTFDEYTLPVTVLLGPDL